MASGIPRYQLFRRPAAARHDWSRAGRLALQIARDGVDAVLTEVAWCTEDGAETSLTLPGLAGIHLSPNGKAWEVHGEPAPSGVLAPGHG
jgi:hypothetical protein